MFKHECLSRAVPDGGMVAGRQACRGKGADRELRGWTRKMLTSRRDVVRRVSTAINQRSE
ncbi:MAG: hypothetical protein II894_00700 [Bacteroidales bacterium]|nr:hypothetical protein [Bacteroidales bacterium]